MRHALYFVSCLILLLSACGGPQDPAAESSSKSSSPNSTAGASNGGISDGGISNRAQDPEQPLLITDGWVVTMDAESRVIENGAVAVVGERIEALGTTAELKANYPQARILSAKGGAIVPGLVNTHTHVPMTLFRGMADDLPLMRWLQEVIFPAEAKYVDEEMVRVGTRLACLEMIRGGTTTFVDMYYFEDAIAEETAKCGLRALLGETVIDFPAPDNKTWDGALAYAETFIETWKGHPLVTPAIAPHAVYTVSAEHLAQSHAIAAKHDVPVLIHLAEHPSEMESVRKLHDKGPIDYLDQLGLLDDRIVAAHVVLPTDEEIARMAELGVGAAHCPQSNMKLGAGVSPVPKMLKAGMAVGLGTDGPASNNDLDLWEEIDTAAKLHKLELLDPTVIDASTAFRMATLGGAEAIDLDHEIGSLEVGKKADLVIVGLDGPHQQPLYDLLSSLVYSTKSSDVRSVVVNGQILLENGRFLTLDPDQIFEQARQFSERLKSSETTP